MKINKILVAVCFFLLTIIGVKAEEVHPYLKEIFINGEMLENFDKGVFEYEITVPAEMEEIRIVYTAGEGFKAKHTGPTTLKSGRNEFIITASNTDFTDNVDYKVTVIREDKRSNNNYLSSLIVGGKEVLLEKDKNDYEVQVSNGVERVSISAIPEALNATFVEGYGPREGTNTVTLNGERTNVEVKVQAENEEIRTYTISIVKSNYQSNDATLKSLTIAELPFNFTSSIYEYNLEVENDITEINIEALANNDKAKVKYEKVEKLKEGVNNLVIQVTAEDGTIKEYKLNITRKEIDMLVKNISIEGLVFDFNPSVYSYNIKTSLDTLNFKVTLTKESATSKILNNKDLKNGSVVKIQVKDGDKVVTYNFKIVSSKKSGTEVPLATDISVSKTFLEKYDMLIGLGALGVGVLGTLVAILTRPKKEKKS